MTCGRLEIPSLAELRKNIHTELPGRGKMSVCEIIADVKALQADESNAGSMFQVASQFNLLEMVSPNVTPEQGVGIYEYDHTQGRSATLPPEPGQFIEITLCP